MISRRGGDEGPLVSRMDGDEDDEDSLISIKVVMRMMSFVLVSSMGGDEDDEGSLVSRIGGDEDNEGYLL